MRDLAGRSDPTSRKSFKGSIKFIPITFLWNAQQAHALSMKIIFDLIDVSFGKNHFFEQFLINHLGFFISDSVIISCIFIKEPNFNLYSICLFTQNVIWKKMPIYLQPNFRSSTLQRVRNVNTVEFFYHPYFVRANIIYPPYQSRLLAFSLSLWCVIFCFWAHGLPVVIQILMTTPSVLMGSCLPDK